jgi:hypothetical protein
VTKQPIFSYTKSLFYKIWLAFCFLIIIAAVASSFFVYFQIAHQLRNHLEQRLLWEANFYQQQLNEVFLKVAQKLDSLVSSSAAASANPSLLQNEMKTMGNYSSSIIRSWVAYPNGTLIPSTNSRPDYIKNLPWWHEYLAGKSPQPFTSFLMEHSQSLVGKPFIEESGLTTLVPLISFSLKGIKIVRAAGAQLDLNSALTDNSLIDVNWSKMPVSIYTTDGIMVACPYRYNRGNIKLLSKPSRNPLIRQMLAHPNDTSGFANYFNQNQKMIGVFVKDPYLGMVLTVEYPAAEVVDPISRIASGPLIIIVLLLLIATCVIIIIYSNTKRLRQVEDLARSAELRALQARINPHFLFNTLDCLVGLGVSTGNTSLIKMIRSLTNIFRYTIRNMGDLVTFEEELNYLKEYVSLQQVRYRSKFTFELSVPHELLNIKVFKFCIQPLVENCFIHGVEKSLDPISIIVRATRNGNDLEICIVDDGPGMTPERLQEIIKSLELETYESGSQGHGVGVSNIHHRLQYTYGPRYGIRFQPLQPGLAVYLTLPVVDNKLP